MKGSPGLQSKAYSSAFDLSLLSNPNPNPTPLTILVWPYLEISTLGCQPIIDELLQGEDSNCTVDCMKVLKNSIAQMLPSLTWGFSAKPR